MLSTRIAFTRFPVHDGGTRIWAELPCLVALFSTTSYPTSSIRIGSIFLSSRHESLGTYRCSIIVLSTPSCLFILFELCTSFGRDSNCRLPGMKTPEGHDTMIERTVDTSRGADTGNNSDIFSPR